VARYRPVTDADRQQILDLARAGQTRNAIARQVKRSNDTVSKICAEAGHTFDRTATEAATKAKQRDNQARRAELIEGMYDDALRLRAQLFAPCTLHNFGGKDNTHNSIDLDEPVFGDKRSIAQAVRQLADGAANLERVDNGAGVDDATSMLAGIAAGIVAAHEAATATPDADAST
jgi:hypothetical protein